jgi:co-chaperonin GroES (HSP10)
MIKNESGLHPKGHAVLVKPYEAELLSSIIEIPATVKDSLEVLETRVVVLEVGGSAWQDEREPRAVVGDCVFVTKFAGFVCAGADGRLYRLVNDRDVFCNIDQKLFEAKGTKPTMATNTKGRKLYDVPEVTA